MSSIFCASHKGDICIIKQTLMRGGSGVSCAYAARAHERLEEDSDGMPAGLLRRGFASSGKIHPVDVGESLCRARWQRKFVAVTSTALGRRPLTTRSGPRREPT